MTWADGTTVQVQGAKKKETTTTSEGDEEERGFSLVITIPIRDWYR